MSYLFNKNYRIITRVSALIVILFNTLFAYSKQLDDGDRQKTELTVTSKIVIVSKGIICSIHKGTRSLSEVYIKENQSLETGDSIAKVMVLKYASEEERTVYLNESKRLLLLLGEQKEVFKKTKRPSEEAQIKNLYQRLDSLKSKYEALQEYVIKHRGEPSIVTNILVKNGDEIKPGDMIANTIDIGIILPKGTIDEEYYRSKLASYDVIASISGNNMLKQEINISDLLNKRDTSNVWVSHGEPLVGDFVIPLNKGGMPFLDQIVEVKLLLKKK